MVKRPSVKSKKNGSSVAESKRPTVAANNSSRSMSLACRMAWQSSGGEDGKTDTNIAAKGTRTTKANNAGNHKLLNRRKKKTPLVLSTKATSHSVVKKKK